MEDLKSGKVTFLDFNYEEFTMGSVKRLNQMRFASNCISSDQYCTVTSFLMEQFPSKTTRFITFIFDVLFPTILLQVIASRFKLTSDEAHVYQFG